MIPISWGIAGGSVIAVSSFFYGLHIGNERLEAFQEKVESVGKIQEAKNAQTIARQKALTETISHEYENRIKSIQRRFATWVPIGAGGRTVPTFSCPSTVPDATPQDVISLGEYRTLAGLCAETTQQLVSLQKWASEVARQ